MICAMMGGIGKAKIQMDYEKIKVVCVIVAYNDYSSLYRCIDSIGETASHIIVVDNSTNGAEFKHNRQIIYISNDANIGLSKALNIGIIEALKLDCDWVCLLDQDSQLGKNMISNMLYSYNKNMKRNEIAQIVPVIYDTHKKKYLPAHIYNTFSLKKIYKNKEDCYINFQITSGSMIKTDLIKYIGFMDENLFIDYIDYDYCFRILKKEYKILLSSDAILYHALGEVKQKLFFSYVEHSPFRIFHQVRNRIILIKKHGKSFPYFAFKELLNLVFKLGKIILVENNKFIKIKNYLIGFMSGIQN